LNRAKTYLQDLAPLSCTSPVDMWLMGQVRGLVPMWRHVGLSRAKQTGATQSRRLLWRDWQTCFIGHRLSPAMSDNTTHKWVAPTTMTPLTDRIWLPSLFLFFSPLFLSFFLLLYSPCDDSIGDFEFPPKFKPLVWEINFMS
jgi:hypothetical protein